jgi:hypothetical protein
MADDVDILDRGVVPESGRAPADLFTKPVDPPTTVPGPTSTAEPVTTKPADLEPPKSVSPRPPTATETMYPRFMEETERQIEETKKARADLEASQKRYYEAATHKLEATRPEREAELKGIDEDIRFLREHPRQPPAELPERPKLRYNLGELFGPNGQGVQVMNAISVFASLSGRTTQERLMFALTAFNGMVEGWAKGKTDDFNQRYKEWQDQVEVIRDSETRKRQYINDVLNDRKITSELRNEKLKALAVEDQDRMALELLNQQNIIQYDKFGEEQYKLFQGALKAAEDFDKHVNTAQNDAVWDTKAALAFKGNARDAMRGVSSRNIEKYTDAINRYGATHGMSQEQIATALTDAENKIDAQRIGIRRLAAAGPAAIAQIQRDVAMTRVAVDAYERLARKQIDTWIATGLKVDDFGSTVVNRWERWLKKEFAGDADVFAFDLMSQSVRNEVQRVLTTTRMSAILTVNAQREGKEWMDTGMPKAAMFRVASQIKQEFDNRISSMDEEQMIVNQAQDIMSQQLGVTTVTPTFPSPSSAPGAGVTHEYDPATGSVSTVGPARSAPTLEFDPATGTLR